MKKSNDKNEIRLLGRMLDAEIEASDHPDMTFVRESAGKIEAVSGKLSDSELEARLASITGARPSSGRFKKRKLTVSLIAAALVAAMVFAVAASPSVWKFLTFPFTKNSGQLTEVPEGYVGIYTADDLDLIRNDPEGSFILMSDIDLGGKEHTPIGDHLSPFDGRFNGNGHVISNFTITASGAAVRETVSVEEMNARYRAAKKKLNDGDSLIDAYNLPAYAIFGIDGGFDESYSVTNTADDYDMQYISAVGFFGNAGNSTIIGLGVEDATVTVTDSDYTAVGVIAGQVGYISSCYVKNSTVTVGANTADVEAFKEYTGTESYDVFDYMEGYYQRRKTVMYSISAGLLCGEAFAIDSCYTDGELNASGSGSDNVDYSTVSAGLIAGYGSSAVSSYSTGKVNIEGNVFSSQGILGKKRIVPAFIYISAFKSLLNDCMSGGYLNLDNAEDRNRPDIAFDKKKFAAFYEYDCDNALLDDPRYADIRELEEVFFISGRGTATDENFCKLYQLATRYEMMYFQHILDELGDADAIEALYRSEGMRIGDICCYTPEGKESADYYEGFDFIDVWTMKKGIPELKIFE